MDRRAIMGGAGVARLGVLGDLLRTAARDRPEAEAFRYRGERLTYRDWDTLADETAAALAARGIGRGDVVALLLPSTPFYLVGYLAAARPGAIATGINGRYRRPASGAHPGAPPAAKHLAAGLSFAHVGTMARIAIQLSHRAATLIHDAFDPAAVLETIERERLEHLGGIPTQVVMLLDHPDRARRDLSSLKSVLLGGAPSSPELVRRVRDTLGVEVSVRYSSTEVAIATASLADDPPERLATTVGRATPGVELRIVDERNAPVPAGTPGEVVVRSPAAMVRYWRDPEATAATIDAEGWVHTGDVGFLDDAGYLHLRGRQSEMFICGGFNVYPAEIEDLLARHPKVARAAVVGLPHEVFGEVGWAFVVPRDPADPPTLAELRAFVGAELASFKRPDGLRVLGELPLTPMFKVDTRALRAMGLWRPAPARR